MIKILKYLFFLLILFMVSNNFQSKTNYFSRENSSNSKIFSPLSQSDKHIWNIVDNMSIDELSGQMIITYPDKNIIQMGVGGIILFHHHIKSKKGIQKLLKKYNKWSTTPLFVMVDQEGGKVNCLKNISKYKTMPSAQKFGTWPDKKIIKYTDSLGDYLKKLKINTVLAPCLDVSAKKSLMYRSERSFGNNFKTVKKKGKSFAKGFNQSKILTIGKHFPGYGDAIKNSDTSVVKRKINKSKLNKHIDVYEFAGKNLDGIMMSSIIYNKIDPKPAVFSKKLTAKAREIIPDGLIISDDIQSKAIRDYIRKYKKAVNKTIKSETVIHSKNIPYSWSFTISEIKYTVDMAFDAGITLFITLDPQKAIFIKHYLKEKAEENEEVLKILKKNVYLIMKKKIKVYPENFPNV